MASLDEKQWARIRNQRAENMLECELWRVVNEFKDKKATKCESKLTRIDILHVLCGMAARVAVEMQWGNK